MKFSGKMCLKGHKKPGFHPVFRRYIFRNTTGGGGVNLNSPPPLPRHFRVKDCLMFMVKAVYINTRKNVVNRFLVILCFDMFKAFALKVPKFLSKLCFILHNTGRSSLSDFKLFGNGSATQFSFLTSSIILIFLSNVRHRLLSLPACFFNLMDVMLL